MGKTWLAFAGVLCSVGLLTSCNLSSHPSSASDITSAGRPATGAARLLASGTVFLVTATDRTPLANAVVALSSATDVEYGRTTTGPDGSYSITGTAPAGVVGFVTAAFGANRQPCAAMLTLGGTHDVEVVTDSTFEGTRLPGDAAALALLTGGVLRDTPQGRQPVAGASVGLIVGPTNALDGGETVASTITDSNGLFLFCGLPRPTPGGALTIQAGATAGGDHLFGEALVNLTGDNTSKDVLLSPSGSAALGARAQLGKLFAGPTLRHLAGPGR